MGRGSTKMGAALAAALSLCSAAACAQGATRNVTVVTPLKLQDAGADNPAGVAIDILPADQLAIGSKVTFRVTTKKPGYLILVDVDASGKVTQRYPNLYSMTLPAGASDNANLVQPGKPAVIPDLSNPFAHFEYVAEAPTGPGLIVALLSPKPVQVVDLPDVPPNMLGEKTAVDFLFDAARRLRIAGRDGEGGLADPQWSFAVRPYAITP